MPKKATQINKRIFEYFVQNETVGSQKFDQMNFLWIKFLVTDDIFVIIEQDCQTIQGLKKKRIN